ncbi:amino acid permease, partial [Lactiplantibacillus pentosus]|nr:amino acid permease [Lactiplantibacillus pentosus]
RCKMFANISSSGVPAAAIAFTASLVLITPIMSLTTAISSVFTIVTGVSSDMYIIVYTLTLVAHRRYRASTDFLPNGFIMPWYKITSPLTILFFGIIFISLFFIPEDIVGAVGAICWTLIFGGIEFLRQGKTNLNNTN